MTDVFLSYSREDRASARHIADCFAAEDITVWWDTALRSGETFDEVIEQRLKEAKAVVVLWTPRSVASRWVRAEATLADRKNKLVPVIIEPCDRPIAFELTHTADLSEWTGDISDVRWRNFVQDVRSKIDGEDAGSPAPIRARSAPTVRKAQQAPERSEPVSRSRLRPGSDDVIFAATSRRSPVADVTHIGRNRPSEPAPDVETQDEVHCLTVVDGDLAEQLFVVSTKGVKIGRVAPADVVLPDRSVSREHCVIGLANDELLVTDLNSTNGTYIDEQRVSRAAILPVGSVLRVGQISLKHEVRTGSEAQQWSDQAA